MNAHLSNDVDFQTKSTTKLCVQSVGTPALLFSSIATSSPKSCHQVNEIVLVLLRSAPGHTINTMNSLPGRVHAHSFKK